MFMNIQCINMKEKCRKVGEMQEIYFFPFSLPLFYSFWIIQWKISNNTSVLQVCTSNKSCVSRNRVVYAFVSTKRRNNRDKVIFSFFLCFLVKADLQFKSLILKAGNRTTKQLGICLFRVFMQTFLCVSFKLMKISQSFLFDET